MQQNYFQFRDAYFQDAVNRAKFLYLKSLVMKYRPERMLDIGSGKGVTALEFHRFAGEIHGLEYNQRNLKEAEQYRKEVGIENVFFHRGDGRKLPFQNGYFDLVMCSQVLEHIEKPEEVVREIARVSSDNILIDVPTPLWEAWQFSYWLLNKIRNPYKAIKRYREVKAGGGSTIKRAFQPDHVNKWSPWKWKNLIEESGLEVKDAWSCYMSPTKKFNLLGPVEKRLGKTRPFSYMGMVFFVRAKKK